MFVVKVTTRLPCCDGRSYERSSVLTSHSRMVEKSRVSRSLKVKKSGHEGCSYLERPYLLCYRASDLAADSRDPNEKSARYHPLNFDRLYHP